MYTRSEYRNKKGALDLKKRKKYSFGDGKFPVEEGSSGCGCGWLLVQRGHRPPQLNIRPADGLALLLELLSKLFLHLKRRVLFLRPPLLLRRKPVTLSVLLEERESSS